MKNWGLTAKNIDFPHMVSALFLHGSPLHLIGNMWFLYLFGFAVEGRLRTPKFLLVYFGAGFCGNLLHHFLFSALHPDVPLIGASGAIMGVLGAAIYIFPYAQVAIYGGFTIFSWQAFDWPMWGVGLYYIGFDMLFALLGARDGVGHFAHIGGVAGGFLLCFLIRIHRDSETVSMSKSVVADTKDLGVLSRMELEEMYKVNPGDVNVVLHWAIKSLRDPRGITPECTKAFIAKLPMLLESDVRSTGTVVIQLPVDMLSVRNLTEVATRLERASDFHNAFVLFDRIMCDPRSQPADVESSAFRLGMLCESAYRDLGRAAEYYTYIVNTWPMGSFADQAKARLAYIKKQRGTPKATP